MSRGLLVALLLATVLAASGCGGDTKTVTVTNEAGQATTRTVPDVKFAKTQFVLHTGLAIGAFRRYIYKPSRAGAFAPGAEGRTVALAKAAAAGAFTANEVRLARNAALSDDTLRGVGDKLGVVGDQLKRFVPGLEDGKIDAGDVASIAAQLGGVTELAKSLGVSVPERSVPIPGS
jgi:hypothetical protein